MQDRAHRARVGRHRCSCCSLCWSSPSCPRRGTSWRPFRAPERRPVLEAFGLGVLGASSLLFAGLVACWLDVPPRLIGILAGFGAGALIAAISFDLVVEAEDVLERWQFALWMLVGVAVFLRRRQGGGGALRPGGSGRCDGHRRRLRGGRGARVDHLRDPGRNGLPDQLEFHGCCVRLQHPSEHRTVRRPVGCRMDGATRRNTLVLGRARMRHRGGSRLPGH